MSRLTALAATLLLSPALAAAAEAAGPKLTLSGMVDSYYTLNLTAPQGYTSPTNPYNGVTGFNLNFAKVTAVAESGPASFRLDLGFGPEGRAITTDGTGNDSRLFVEQAIATMRFGKLTVDAGRFVTPAGFEVFESKDNWLYSKGLLFTFAVPTAHEGVRVSMPLTPELTVAGTLANGSDLFTNDTGNTGSPYKTLILGGTYAKEATSVAGNVFISKDPATTENAFLVDVVFTQGMGATSFNVSGDYGSFAGSSYFGLGGSVKHALAEDGLKIVGRIEYFSDEDAVHTGAGTPPGEGPSLMSFTGGVNYPVGANAELRAELRLDRASEKVYPVPSDPSETMVTFTAAAIAWF